MFVVHVRVRGPCVCVRHLRRRNLCDIFDVKTAHTHLQFLERNHVRMDDNNTILSSKKIDLNIPNYTYCIFNVFIQKKIFALSPFVFFDFCVIVGTRWQFQLVQMGMPNHWIHICASQYGCMCATAHPYYLIRHRADLWDKYRIVMTMLSVALWFVVEKKSIYICKDKCSSQAPSSRYYYM